MERKKGNDYDEIFKLVKHILDDIGYGSVTLVVQDGVIVQVERQEKIWLK